jgi:phosphatidylglycerophosphate synthase
VLSVDFDGVRPATRTLSRRGRLRPFVVPLVGLVAQVVVLSALISAGVGLAGWLLGFAYGLCVTALLGRALIRSGQQRLGPADKVTLVRSVLIGGVLAMVITDFVSPVPTLLLVSVGTVALVLDGVDGKVARRTGTASELGARFDYELDAFLILILSVHAGGSVGWWVLLIGAARALFVAAGFRWRWLRGALPRRYWAKVVAVIQAVVLLIVATGLLPTAVNVALCLVALVLLTEAFGRSIWWLAVHRDRR